MKFVSSDVAEVMYNLKHDDDDSLTGLPQEYRLTLMEPELERMTDRAAYIMPFIMKLMDQCKLELEGVFPLRRFVLLNRMVRKPHGLTESDRRKFRALAALADGSLLSNTRSVEPADFVDGLDNIELVEKLCEAVSGVIRVHPLWNYFESFQENRLVDVVMEYADYFVCAPYAGDYFDVDGVGTAFWSDKIPAVQDFIKSVNNLPAR